MSDKLFLISAGHTNAPGQDRGAAGSGYIEGVEAVEIRDSLAATLRNKGCSVIEDGADGVSEPLKKAIVLARKADVAIEIHFNAGPPAATGIEVLAKSKHTKLAQRLAQAIHDATGIKLRGDGGWKSDSSGQHHRLGFCEAGGLIVEMCFISNASDMAAYKNNFGAVIDNLAAALTGGKSTVSEFPTPSPDPSNSITAPVTIEVSAGQTLWGIASLHRTSVAELKRPNGLTSDAIATGQTLIIR